MEKWRSAFRDLYSNDLDPDIARRIEAFIEGCLDGTAEAAEARYRAVVEAVKGVAERLAREIDTDTGTWRGRAPGRFLRSAVSDLEKALRDLDEQRG